MVFLFFFLFFCFFFFVVVSTSGSDVLSSSMSSSSSSSFFSLALCSLSFGLGGISNPRSNPPNPPSFSLGGGGIPSSLSTQHLMLLVGHSTSSNTSSQMREARAWIHFPGQESTLAVLVTDPSNPERNEPNPLPPPGLGRGRGSCPSARSPRGLSATSRGAGSALSSPM